MEEMFARNGENADGKNVTNVTSFADAARWRLRALGFNPLVRIVDRLEALVVLAVLVTALVALPFAMSAGTLVYQSGMRTANEQAHSRHSVDALVVEGSGLPTDVDTPANTPAYVRVQWHEGTRVRTEQVLSPTTIKAGDQTTVWLDDSGKVVAAPLRPGDAKLNAIVATGTVWTVLVVISALVAYLVHRGLDRSRDRGWDHELHLLAHSDDGWVNRRT
jgi:hypothetical protein